MKNLVRTILFGAAIAVGLSLAAGSTLNAAPANPQSIGQAAQANSPITKVWHCRYWSGGWGCRRW